MMNLLLSFAFQYSFTANHYLHLYISWFEVCGNLGIVKVPNMGVGAFNLEHFACTFNVVAIC